MRVAMHVDAPIIFFTAVFNGFTVHEIGQGKIPLLTVQAVELLLCWHQCLICTKKWLKSTNIQCFFFVSDPLIL